MTVPVQRPPGTGGRLWESPARPNAATEPTCPPRRLLDRVRDAIARRNYSLRTEEVYVGWIKRFILYHSKRHPLDLESEEVEAFLTHLACEQKVAASTQNQALCALLFLYREVLDRELPWMDGFARAKTPARSPTVLSQEEVAASLAHVDGTRGLMVELLYGAGLRLMECARLRVRDLDFERLQITVRAGKGDRDRVTILPACLEGPLRNQVARVAHLHGRDLQAGFGATAVPGGRRPDTARNLGGSMCSPRRASYEIGTRVSCNAATAIRRACNVRSGGPRAQRRSVNR